MSFFTMEQHFDRYTEEDRWVWNTLFTRQLENLQDKACSEYLSCLKAMEPVLHPHDLPNLKVLNAFLAMRTGWQIEIVPGLIPVEKFFALLSQRKFCSSTWVRSRQQLDYLEEPDMFHDIFGHIPLLLNEDYRRFMEWFGVLGCAATTSERVIALQRLYWFTIEFGVMQEEGERKVYGAGLCSSFKEASRALQPEIPVVAYDRESVMQRPFRNDVVQETYVEIRSFRQMFESVEKILVKAV
ncbi:MAG: phenylalanine-4-hydroxylase [Salibacteraceae bacterium]